VSFTIVIAMLEELTKFVSEVRNLEIRYFS